MNGSTWGRCAHPSRHYALRNEVTFRDGCHAEFPVPLGRARGARDGRAHAHLRELPHPAQHRFRLKWAKDADADLERMLLSSAALGDPIMRGRGSIGPELPCLCSTSVTEDWFAATEMSQKINLMSQKSHWKSIFCHRRFVTEVSQRLIFCHRNITEDESSGTEAKAPRRGCQSIPVIRVWVFILPSRCSTT